MKLLIDTDDKDYELLKKTAIEIDWDIAWHGKEKDREMIFALFNLVKALKNGIPYKERPQGDLISRETLLKRIDEERKYLLARGQTGAEHILVHNFRNLVEDAQAEELEEIISKFRNTAYRNGYITGLNKRPQNDWGKWVISEICCPNCFNYLDMDYYSKEELNKCPICGEDMWEGGTKE